MEYLCRSFGSSAVCSIVAIVSIDDAQNISYASGRVKRLEVYPGCRKVVGFSTEAMFHPV